MIQLFSIPNYKIDTSSYSSLLHDKVVTDFEQAIAEFVGAKYAVSFNSATSAIFLSAITHREDNKVTEFNTPSIMPPVVPNALITSGNRVFFNDNTSWVGGSYTLHDYGDFKIIDSAQRLEKDQFSEASPDDLMVFSFYPTKPVGSCDGGMIVSNDENKIGLLKEASINGMSFSNNNWERKVKFPGYKMYMNSIQADIGLRNLANYPSKLARLDEVRRTYNEAFSLDNRSHHLYRLRLKNRDEFIRLMKWVEIQCGIHYAACHQIPCYRSKAVLPNSDAVSSETVSIPFHENLSPADIKKVIKYVKRFARY